MNSTAIIQALDQYLINQNKLSVNAVEANEYLAKKGLLRDSTSRPGAPLRKLLRDGLIPHAYQDGVKWVIPNSNQKVQSQVVKASKVIKSKSSSTGHKLEPIVKILRDYIEFKHKSRPEIHLEYKPDWLRIYPDIELIEQYSQIQKVHEALTDGKVDFKKVIEGLDERQKSAKQSYDIWIGEPYNTAVEFDENQHFNQFRLLTLDFYQDIKHKFPISIYQKFCKEKIVKPGSSGFQKLKSNDPLFPELFSGPKQDNRIRQRAFRDYLKDILPLHHKFGATLRIPFQIVGKIKDFNHDDMKVIANYIANQKLI